MRDLVKRGVWFVLVLWASLIALALLYGYAEGADCESGCTIPAPAGALNPSVLMTDENWQVKNVKAATDDSFVVFFVEAVEPVDGRTHALAVFDKGQLDLPVLFSYVENGSIKGEKLVLDKTWGYHYVWDPSVYDPEVYELLCSMFTKGFPNPPKLSKRLSV